MNWFDVLLNEARAELDWLDAWERCYSTGLYASIPESHRKWLRTVNQHYHG